MESEHTTQRTPRQRYGTIVVVEIKKKKFITFIPIPEKNWELKPMYSHHRDTMINTVWQLMHNIRLFCGTECSAASSWRQARTKFLFLYHRWSRYRSCGKRVTDSSQAVIISFVPTSFKLPHYLRPMRARDTTYFESYATDVFITPCLSPCSVEEC